MGLLVEAQDCPQAMECTLISCRFSQTSGSCWRTGLDGSVEVHAHRMEHATSGEPGRQPLDSVARRLPPHVAGTQIDERREVLMAATARLSNSLALSAARRD